MSDKLTLVTGAAGFVGSAVARRLLSEGVPVRAMVRREEQARELVKLGAEVAIADLRDESAIKRAVDGVRRVVHIAALFRRGSVTDAEFAEVNIEGTRKLLDASCSFGIKRFVHCSTIGVHGHIENPPGDENSPFAPADAYQSSKLAGEQLARSYFEQGRISGAVIRPAMVYGPHDTRTQKLFKMISKRTFFYVGQGTGSVHFIDVRDLARAFHAALDREHLNNQVYIIAGETTLPLRDVVRIIASLYGVKEPWLHLPVKLMQVAGTLCEAICAPLGVEPPIFRRRVDFFTKNRAFNCAKAQADLAFAPAQHLVQELLDIIASYAADGSVPLPVAARPSVLVRDLEGKIVYWDRDAEQAYGWSRSKAVGSISHDLLSTGFPQDLKSINQQLIAKNRWSGKLKHRRVDGSNVSVQSHWQMLPRLNSEPLVAEINRIYLNQETMPALRAGAGGAFATVTIPELLSMFQL